MLMTQLPHRKPPKQPSVLLREAEIDRQLGLLKTRSWRDRLLQGIGRTLIRIGHGLVERTDVPNGSLGVRNAEQN